MTLVSHIKNALLPSGKRFRPILFGPAAGCTMHIDFHHDFRRYIGIYERELIPQFRQLVNPGDRAFDVGGQAGYDALIIAKGSDAEVVSFECDHAAAEEMRVVFSRNPRFAIQTVEAFVGDRDEPGYITLDSAAERYFMPDFIKIDIEGAELLALQGASRILTKRMPALIIETHGLEIERACIASLVEHGYSPQVIDQRMWPKEERVIEHNRWLVCAGRAKAR